MEEIGLILYAASPLSVTWDLNETGIKRKNQLYRVRCTPSYIQNVGARLFQQLYYLVQKLLYDDDL